MLYVSQSTGNGYHIGNNSWNGLAKTWDGGTAGPKADVDAAITVASSLDTIKINDGAYLPTVLDYYDINKTLTLVAENPRQTTLNGVAGQFRIFKMAGAGVSLTVQDCIVDNAGSITTAFSTGGADSCSLVIDGSEIAGNFTGTTGMVSNTTWTSIEFKNTWAITGTFAQSAITVGPTVASSLAFSGTGDFSPTLTGTTVHAIKFTPSAGGCTYSETGITYNPTIPDVVSISEGKLHNIAGVTTVDIYDMITVPDFVGANVTSGIEVLPHASIPCTHCHILDNFVHLDMVTKASQRGIMVGRDDATSRDMITGVKVDRNDVAGAEHGLMLGYITGAKGYENTVDFCQIGTITKGSGGECEWVGTEYSRCEKYMHAKFTTATDVFANGTLILSADYKIDIIFLEPETVGVNPTVGTQFLNNDIYSAEDATKFLNDSGGLNTAAVEGNNFYSSGTGSGASFRYSGVDYPTLAAFESAIATAQNNTEVVAGHTDFENGDYSLAKDSVLLGTGKNWWGNEPNPTGHDGEPFSNIDTDIGYIQSKHSPFHPVNL